MLPNGEQKSQFLLYIYVLVSQGRAESAVQINFYCQGGSEAPFLRCLGGRPVACLGYTYLVIVNPC